MIACFIAGYCKREAYKFVLIDAKITAGIDDKFMPINITDKLPADTSKVYCCFNGETPLKILKSFRDDMPILDYTFIIPRKNGIGSVALEMPQGKLYPKEFIALNLGLKIKN